MTSQKAMVLYTQFIQFFVLLGIAFYLGVTDSISHPTYGTLLGVSGISVVVRGVIERSKYELRDKEGRRVTWKVNRYEKWFKGYYAVKVRDLPDWFLPVHIALFTLMSVAYVLIASMIVGELIFLRPGHAHLSFPVIVFYHFVTDFEGWKRILTNPKALYYSFIYSAAGVIFWFVMMQIGVFPSFRELFMVGE